MGLPKIKFIIASNGLELLTTDIQKIPGLVITDSTVVLWLLKLLLERAK